ncbi:MAG: [citrate (pro-3S)-lyase] ligase [Enterobacterales bacterium]|uniref:[Citrate [pro-3S]-lyase] ligase n=1 Tax=Obesumbacterium proteus ATCC 12841 TaxID=1354268 RepID=A0AA91EGM5_9GAMM|nr:[citrate (pro-3S)-lyase] ligase [Obesumbacterium proteus]MDN6073369.1 [citrate (pro-3S)-lyase] ligase [Enterobacterales bacterium]AMO79839.1 [citrate (pro-3S)-lyase] ligase [Obesumbacterium proteus]KKI48547.1 [citrate [pro-3S]-lyase] ligase [Obesumbacterium proteus]MCE9884716.1 [citrate (pro-3S)-lyase] ligase [Obesumbacterium proteus]MCE9917763.1 [citrate (pro-3S)-lyase] ligase [Obesumbacterium proteus]
MFGNTVFSQVKRSENKKIAVIAHFLRENGLSIDSTVEVFITVTRDDQLIACGGIAGNIIKCVAISESVRGEGLALTLATELINLAYEKHCTHLFIYTKTQNEALFKQCGFYTVTSVPNVMVLMENSATRIQRYASYLTTLRHDGNKIGSIVMNANPFTNGHRYLVQQAAAQCDWLHLFLVKEDTSRFPYEDRLELVRAGTADIKNLTVHRGSEYIISRATFPCYFIKEQGVVDDCYTEIDLKIFRQYLAPALGITHRFVGTEPYCQVTAKYNRDMRHWLETPSLPAPPIELVEIERLQYHDTAISASWVRKLLVQKDLPAIAPLVPEATRAYLQRLLVPRSENVTDRPQESALVTGEK